MDSIIIKESQTVGEFIETLKQFPQGTPIRVNSHSGVEIYHTKEFYDGDSANPNCKIIEAVVVY